MASLLSNGLVLRVPVTPDAALRVGLRAAFYWTESAGSPRASSLGGHTLAEVGGPVPVTAPPPGLAVAAQSLDFAAAGGAHLFGAAGLPVQSAANDLTVAVWLRQSAAGVWESACGYGLLGTWLAWEVYLTANLGLTWHTDLSQADQGGRPGRTDPPSPLDGWTLAVCEHRASAPANVRNAIRLRRAEATNQFVGPAPTYVPPPAGAGLLVGRGSSTSSFNAWTGRVGPLWVWDRLLTPAERQVLADGGCP